MVVGHLWRVGHELCKWARRLNSVIGFWRENVLCVRVTDRQEFRMTAWEQNSRKGSGSELLEGGVEGVLGVW